MRSGLAGPRPYLHVLEEALPKNRNSILGREAQFSVVFQFVLFLTSLHLCQFGDQLA